MVVTPTTFTAGLIVFLASCFLSIYNVDSESIVRTLYDERRHSYIPPPNRCPLYQCHYFHESRESYVNRNLLCDCSSVYVHLSELEDR